jgi:predicted RNA-binding protein with PUA-like domain
VPRDLDTVDPAAILREQTARTAGEEKAIVGIAEVASAPYADPKQNDPKLAVFELKPKRRLSRAVSLAEVKANEKLKDFELVRMARLSVMPVTDAVWKVLMKMAGQK